MTPEEVRDEALAQLIYHQMRAKSIWPEITLELSPLDFSLRGGTIGTAIEDSKRSVIRLNLSMLTDHPHEIKPTVVHELAHVINRRLADHNGGWRPSPHGDQWRMIMHRLGMPAERTHSISVAAYSTKRKTQKYNYQCPCGRHFVIGAIRHKNCQNGWKTYYCTACRRDLALMHYTDLGRV